MATVLEQFQNFHAALEPARRRILYAATGLSLVTVAGVALWASQPDNVILTRASDPDEAQTIARSLALAEVPYTIDSDGITVRVPREVQVDARRAASSDGGIVGLEGLEQIDPWVTPFQEQLHRVRMIQGELVRTLNAINGIASSTVHITFPEHTAFLGDSERPTAAVTLRPDAGASIDRATARSVAELVSHAVSGMTSADVTVVDSSSGRLIWSGSGDDGLTPDGSPDMAVLSARRETQLADGVRAALAHLLGTPDAAAVTVHVELETSAVQSTVNAVDPDSAVAISEKIETDSDAKGSSTASGVPGTDSNLPERTPSSGSSSSGGRNREMQQTNFQVTTTTTTTTKPAGDIRRLSAAVMIDQKAVTAAAAGGDEAAFRKELEAGVQAALGVNAKRGDSVVVSFVPFAPVAEAESDAAAVSIYEAVATWDRFLPAVIVMAAIGAAYLFLVRPLLAAVRPPPAPANPLLVADGPIDGELERGGGHFDDRLRARLERLDARQPSQINNLVRQESAQSAEVLRRWIRT